MKFTRNLSEKIGGIVLNDFEKEFDIYLNPTEKEFVKLFNIVSQVKGTLTTKGDLIVWIHKEYPKGLEHGNVRRDPLFAKYMKDALYNFYLFRDGARPYKGGYGRIVEWSLSDEQWKGLSKFYKPEVLKGLKARIPDLKWAVFGDYIVNVETDKKYANYNIYNAARMISHLARKKK